MTLQQAFKQMMKQPEVLLAAGVSRFTIYRAKQKASDEKKRELLIKAGYTQAEHWHRPVKK